jgi:predicted nucleic acid-binding protein
VNNNPANRYVVDSFALLAYLENAAGANLVEERLQAALRNESLLYLSTINLGEMVYIIERERGLPTAQLALAQLQQLPIQLLEATLSRILAAAHVKAHYPISYADAFVVAAAREMGATILTGDPEFAKVTTLVNIAWLPQT